MAAYLFISRSSPIPYWIVSVVVSAAAAAATLTSLVWVGVSLAGSSRVECPYCKAGSRLCISLRNGKPRLDVPAK
jgi:hypothetical protein